jgi:hypothetical protein
MYRLLQVENHWTLMYFWQVGWHLSLGESGWREMVQRANVIECGNGP